MIYYKLLAILDLLFVGFVMRVTLGELKVLSDTPPKLFVIFLALISALMITLILMTKLEKKIITYKGKQIEISNSDKMFIRLIRKNNYEIDDNLKKLMAKQSSKFAKLTSIIITIAVFIKIGQIINLKINLSQNIKLVILLIVMAMMFFVGLGVLFDTRATKYNIILPYYKNLILLETIKELDKKDNTNAISFLKKYQNAELNKDSINELKKEIKEGNDWVSLLIEIDKNTDFLR